MSLRTSLRSFGRFNSMYKHARSASTIADKFALGQSFSSKPTSTLKYDTPMLMAKNLTKYNNNVTESTSLFSKQTFFSGAAKEESSPLQAPELSDKEVQNLFHLWNDALATLDPDTVAQRYASNSILLPTVSDTPRTDYDSIKAYFVDFLQKKPQGVVTQSKVLKGDGWCLDAGIYEFTLGATGDKVMARYTFKYVFEDEEWKIAHHHSSVMPEGIPAGAEPITEDEVKSLFGLWNDALATLDADAVAKRYSKNAVLLPTVSDLPRTDYALIHDYFTNFLQKKPQGEILESNVMLGHNWAQDAGLYEFTMGATGDKVKGRYTFNYIFEDGEWKISHHHSSVMPEAFLS
eukprot:CAMPEP_0194049590 /NCGR_PEP_ID=MMETSP0009_2-20130614/30776_1 /TAXON_ID=210454 /ORGANISM="Grammatophora oceanica, Strain CCMP 410" /LENGTH=347 /DNA_ID=CAMNT_0038695791 /DNA_START=56 /DNA_END=1099 /DNA_ORIENTATION=+